MKVTKALVVIIGVLNLTAAFAQDERTQEYLRQQEQRKKAETMRMLDSGVYYMDNAQYTLADEKFRYVLEHVKSVPSDLTFYFGKNSFYLNRFKQSIDWLNKYIQLKGTTGQYHDEAIEYLQKSEAEFVKEKSKEAQRVGEVLSVNYDIDCGPAGKVSCPVCKGDHVIIKKAPLGDEYRTCPYCDDHGMLTCQEYNQLLRGQLKRKQ
jgi:hypothetical protein